VFDEITHAHSPELLAEIDPWMLCMKSLRWDTAFGVFARKSVAGFIGA